MSEERYVITEGGDGYCINGVEIDDEIFNMEKVEFRIEDRESVIDDLIRWIAECKNSDKVLMIADLKELMNIDDKYILSSMSTNSFLYGNSEEFNLRCQEILNAI